MFFIDWRENSFFISFWLSNILSVCKNASYIRDQLYSYYVYPDRNTAITDSLNFGFNLNILLQTSFWYLSLFLDIMCK